MNISYEKIARHSGAALKLIASPKSWIEGKAIEQLEKTAELEGMKLAVGLPDLHPGRGYPIGAAFISERLFYPALAGNDIGCGVAFFQTGLFVRKLKLDHAVRKLDAMDDEYFDNPDTQELAVFRTQNGLGATAHDLALGTIGGGNHFAELQRVDEVFNPDLFTSIGLEKGSCQLLVHSGSRGFGEAILRAHIHRYGATGIGGGTEQAEAYFQRHDQALDWASANRLLIARRFLAKLGGRPGNPVLDVPHNLIGIEDWNGERHYIHRKGAAVSTMGPVMVPGSRGSLSYLVMPIGDQSGNALSLAHGAGRRWKRGAAKSRLSHKLKEADLTRPPTGGRVICSSRELLYEEAPQAYKNISEVIRDMEEAGMIRIIASFRPLITYKTRRRS